MAEILQKLRPDRDLQCFFQRPSAIAALSETSESGFTVSGTWRQQFDWAVIDWNRDNVYEHPAFRNLPDGDLSGLTLTYDETRENCIPLDSDLFATVDWPSLRVWADDGTGEKLYKVPLKNHATAIAGAYQPAQAQLTLTGTASAGDFVGFAFLSEHYTYRLNAGETLEFALKNLVDAVQAFSPTMRASQAGASITLIYSGAGQTAVNSTTGSNGNRLGVYTYTTGTTEVWDAPWKLFSGGLSPTKWRITLPFGALSDPSLGLAPAKSIRKMRWTYSADLQRGAFQRSEFQVIVSNWNVTGEGRTASVAGPGSRRIEDDSQELSYQGQWTGSGGNFSGGSIHYSTTNGSAVNCRYHSAQQHSLYLGTRMAPACGVVSVSVNGRNAIDFDLSLAGEDVLTRKLLGKFGPGDYSVSVTNSSPAGAFLYFDYIEIAVPAAELPGAGVENKLGAATDWDTDHSIALAPERTAWMIQKLGLRGRVNHYAGALWFYELVRTGHSYASGAITFSGSPDPNAVTEIRIGRTDQPPANQTAIVHLNLIGDTAESVARAFELQINQGSTAIRAEASGNVLTIFSRSMGVDGNGITTDVSAATANFAPRTSGPTLAGGVDGNWRTDLLASPRLNRAVRDWSRSFYRALHGYGLDVTTSFSMELQHGDPGIEAGIAQRYPSGAAVLLNTPALQTNFSPASAAFWRQVYADMAQVQVEGGVSPYLQFGEVQWWYFPDDHSGMPFYDAYTSAAFRAQFGRDLRLISGNSVDPGTVAEEAQFLPGLIGAFTNQVMAYVASRIPGCRFEVLYPTDVNNTALNRVINYPRADWTPDKLACLKTESFTYTFNRDLDAARQSIDAGAGYNFGPAQRSHLVGIGDASTAWLKEARMAEGSGFESVVLFALDQFCLVGYGLPLSAGMRRSAQFG